MATRATSALVGLLVLVGSALAFAKPYSGKTVTIIVGYKPGGNSIIAANHLYNVAKPDGLTIGTFNRNLPIAQLTKVQGVKYDMTKFAWIGSAANEATILAIRNELPYRNFAELRKAKEPV